MTKPLELNVSDEEVFKAYKETMTYCHKIVLSFDPQLKNNPDVLYNLTGLVFMKVALPLNYMRAKIARDQKTSDKDIIAKLQKK